MLPPRCFHPLGSHLVLVWSIVVWGGLAPGPARAGDDDPRAQIARLLTELHSAAAAADASSYLEVFDDDAVILGTAPEERFDRATFADLVRQSFAGGRGWKSVPFQQSVTVSREGTTAWFDERLRRATLGELRCSGVLAKRPDGWKIVHFNTVVPVPNERFLELSERLKPPARRILDWGQSALDAAQDTAAEAAVREVLIDFHRAGFNADLERYLGHLSEAAVFLGTDPEERYALPDYADWVRPHFARGRGPRSIPLHQNIFISDDGGFAWFDERVHKPDLGTFRGSGVLALQGERWKIVQYHLSVPVPNELLGEFFRPGTATDQSLFTRPLSPVDLLEDFIVLRRTLESWHPALYVYETRESLDRVFDEVQSKLSEPISALEFETLITPVIARVHCVHTRIMPTGAHFAARQRVSTYLPGKVQVIGDRLYLCRNYSDDPELAVGSEILEINGRPAGQVLEQLLALIPSDGFIRSQQLWVLNADFAGLYATHIESPREFDLRLSSPGGEREWSLTLPALQSELWNTRRRERGSVGPSDPEVDLQSEILADEDTAILTLNTFGPSDVARCAEELATFFESVRVEQIGNLILDLRQNPGGSPELGSLLVSYLANQRFSYLAADRAEIAELPLLTRLGLAKYCAPREPARDSFRGEQILVLISGRCTSTSGHVLSLLKHQGRSLFIGEESGATFTCNDNSKDITLQNSGIRVHIARNTFKTPATGLERGRSIQPDYRVRKTLEQVLRGVDVELELARRLIRD